MNRNLETGTKPNTEILTKGNNLTDPVSGTRKIHRTRDSFHLPKGFSGRLETKMTVVEWSMRGFYL